MSGILRLQVAREGRLSIIVQELFCRKLASQAEPNVIQFSHYLFRSKVFLLRAYPAVDFSKGSEPCSSLGQS